MRDRTGISIGTLSKIENGKRSYYPELLDGYAKAMGCKANEFFSPWSGPERLTNKILKIETLKSLVKLFGQVNVELQKLFNDDQTTLLLAMWQRLNRADRAAALAHIKLVVSAAEPRPRKKK